ncbi:MAG: hypothetical protein FWH04_02780, partial [Oscillospiraceae bacterium]|nr:hypothetical protein [Oscillospiraceae bacterium]
MKNGCNRSGTQQILCRHCKKTAQILESNHQYLELYWFVDAYNAFGAAKMKFRQNRDPNSRELPFSVLDFLQS